MKNIVKNLKLLIIVCLVGLGVGYVFATGTYSGPGCAPPGCNTNPPVTQDDASQSKGGDQLPLTGQKLNINGNFSADQLLSFGPSNLTDNTTVGLSNSTAKDFRIFGNIFIQKGSEITYTPYGLLTPTHTGSTPVAVCIVPSTGQLVQCPAPGAPTVTITATTPSSPINTTGQSTYSNSAVTITYDTNNATSCTGTTTLGNNQADPNNSYSGWNGSLTASNGSHTANTFVYEFGVTHYIITCQNAAGTTATASTSVTVHGDYGFGASSGFTIPTNVTSATFKAWGAGSGGAGGGGGSGTGGGACSGSGGGGGGSGGYSSSTLGVTPGTPYTIVVGTGGGGGTGGNNGSNAGTAGAAGTSSSITGGGNNILASGGTYSTGGAGAACNASVGGYFGSGGSPAGNNGGYGGPGGNTCTTPAGGTGGSAVNGHGGGGNGGAGGLNHTCIGNGVNAGANGSNGSGGYTGYAEIIW